MLICYLLNNFGNHIFVQLYSRLIPTVKKYYDILGLPHRASKQAIKAAYRKLAFKYHPDVNKDADAQKKFLEISEAYELLTSPNIGVVRKYTEDKAKAEEEIRKARERAKENMRKRHDEFKEQEEKEQSRQYTVGIYIFVSIVLLMIVSYTGYYSWFNHQVYSNSDTTLGQVTFVDYRSYLIRVVINGNSYEMQKNGDRSFKDLNGENGMPMEIGQEFLVVYNKEDPKYFDVLFEPISRQSFKIYEQITVPKIVEWLTEEGLQNDDYRALCMFRHIYDTFGIEGCAAMYFYNEPLIENTENNAWTFESFRNQEAFKECISFCQIIN